MADETTISLEELTGEGTNRPSETEDKSFEIAAPELKGKKTTVNMSLEQVERLEAANIDPKEFLKVSRIIDKAGQAIVGIYHSHPDHPDQPSEYDRAHAWEIYSYIIVGIQKGTEITMRCFILDGNHQFQEEELRTILS